MFKATIILVVLSFVCSDAYQMTMCELVKKLRQYKYPENQLRDWVCLVEHESSRRTHVINTNKNGSKDYGLFQINDQWWCNSGNTPGKSCNVRCSDLITDDITKAVQCSKLIYQRQGFSAWNGWKSHCQKNLPNISTC